MKVYKLDEHTREITLLDIEDDASTMLETCCKLIGCDFTDIATFSQRDSFYRIVAIVDDWGAYSRPPVCTYGYGIGCLYGTVIFARHYFDSLNFSDVEPEDLRIIKRCVIEVVD